MLKVTPTAEIHSTRRSPRLTITLPMLVYLRRRIPHSTPSSHTWHRRAQHKWERAIAMFPSPVVTISGPSDTHSSSIGTPQTNKSPASRSSSTACASRLERACGTSSRNTTGSRCGWEYMSCIVTCSGNGSWLGTSPHTSSSCTTTSRLNRGSTDWETTFRCAIQISSHTRAPLSATTLSRQFCMSLAPPQQRVAPSSNFRSS